MIAEKATPGTDLDTRIRAVSAALQDALSPIVRQVGGPTARPAALSRRLGIDKTLSGRILRSVRAADPFEVMHEAPAPHGLRIFLSAAAQAGIEPELKNRADESVEQFEALLGEFPDGRAALEAAISDFIPEVRDRNERIAKQGVYKSMSYVLGYQAEAGAGSTVLFPNDDGQTVDSLHIGSKHGLRRLRGELPIKIFGTRMYRPHAGDSWLEALNGKRASTEASDYLLEEYCSKPIPELTVLTEGDQMYTVLDGASMTLNEPISLVTAWINRRGWLRYRTDSQSDECATSLVRIPTKVMVRDYFVHEDLYGGTIPEVRPRMQGLVADRMRRESRLQQLDEVDLSANVVHLGKGLGMADLRVSDIPTYRTMLADAFDRVGLDPSRFMVYRCRMVYPIPFVALTAWFRLPEAPVES